MEAMVNLGATSYLAITVSDTYSSQISTTGTWLVAGMDTGMCCCDPPIPYTTKLQVLTFYVGVSAPQA